jgi:hypothetical protein
MTRGGALFGTSKFAEHLLARLHVSRRRIGAVLEELTASEWTEVAAKYS